MLYLYHLYYSKSMITIKYNLFSTVSKQSMFYRIYTVYVVQDLHSIYSTVSKQSMFYRIYTVYIPQYLHSLNSKFCAVSLLFTLFKVYVNYTIQSIFYSIYTVYVLQDLNFFIIYRLNFLYLSQSKTLNKKTDHLYIFNIFYQKVYKTPEAPGFL